MDKNSKQKNIAVQGQGMISINADLLNGIEQEDDIKPVLVTDIPTEQLQEILDNQKESDKSKAKRKKLKEANKKEKEKKAKWVQIDEQGNKVKAIVETDAEKQEKKRRERKERKKEIKQKFLEEQLKKKNRKQELENKLGITEKKVEPKNKPKRRRMDSDDDNSSDDDKNLSLQAPKPEQPQADQSIAGLQTVEEHNRTVNANMQSLKQSEVEAFDQIKQQKAVIRDKDGRKLDQKDIQAAAVTDKEKIAQMNMERLSMWSKGVVQTQKNDPNDQYDKQLKESDRFGDPMKEIRKYQKGTATEKDKKKLWSRKVFPPCSFEAPPNRFDIEPGHRWDGKDRSNGFEGKWLGRANQQKANKESFYKWASKEM